MNPLKSIWGTILAGIILAIILVFILGSAGSVNVLAIEVWFHAVAGVAWVGLLYYFNFVQVPAVTSALSEADSGGPGPAAINKYVAPRALLWFRWASIATWLSGVAALETLPATSFVKAFTFAAGSEVIGLGAWLGTIMLFNVWVLIWPNQKKILGLDGEQHEATEIARAKTIALMASRTNTLLSIPLLMCMTAYGHGMPF